MTQPGSKRITIKQGKRWSVPRPLVGLVPAVGAQNYVYQAAMQGAEEVKGQEYLKKGHQDTDTYQQSNYYGRQNGQHIGKQ